MSATPQTPQPPPGSPPPPSTPEPADAQAYLADEAKAAKAAIGNTLKELRETLMGKSSQSPDAQNRSVGETVKKTVGEHPWVSVGSALAAGFLISAFTIPSKEQQALRRLAALERAVALHGRDTAQDKPGRGPIGVLLKSVSSTLKPLFAQVVTAAVAAGTAQASGSDGESGQEATNGHTAGA